MCNLSRIFSIDLETSVLDSCMDLVVSIVLIMSEMQFKNLSVSKGEWDSEKSKYYSFINSSCDINLRSHFNKNILFISFRTALTFYK